MRNRTACRPVRRRNSPPLTVQPALRRQDALTMAFGPGDLPALREGVTAYANGFVSKVRLEDLVLVVHELAANVIRHGGGYGSLRLWWDGDRVLCRVSDSGPGLTEIAPEPPSPRMPGGRGLYIARRLSELRIDTGPGGTTITASMPLA